MVPTPSSKPPGCVHTSLDLLCGTRLPCPQLCDGEVSAPCLSSCTSLPTLCSNTLVVETKVEREGCLRWSVMATGGKRTAQLELRNALIIRLNNGILDNLRDNEKRRRLEEGYENRDAICGVIYPYNGNKDEAVIAFTSAEGMDAFIKSGFAKTYGQIIQGHHQSRMENGDIEAKPESDGSTLEVDKYIYDYICDIHKADLENIQSTYKVNINITDSADRQTCFLEVKGVEKNKETSVERLIDLYQYVATNVQECIISIPAKLSEKHSYEFDTLLKQTEAHFGSVVIRKLHNSVFLTGNHKEVGNAVNTLHSYLQDKTKSSTSHEFGAPSSFEKLQQNTDDDSFKGLSATKVSSEFVLEIYKDQLEKLKKKFHFEITVNATSDNMVRIMLKTNGNGEFVYTEAEEAFTDFFQKCRKDIRHVTVKIPDDLKEKQIDNAISSLKISFKNVLFQINKTEMRVDIVGNGVIVDKARNAFCETLFAYGHQPLSSMNEPVANTSTNSSMSNTIKPKHEIKDEDKCSICLEEFKNKTTIDKCKHSFCKDCIDAAMKVKSVCPICQTVYGKLVGNQPNNASMRHKVESRSHLPGHDMYGIITINYDVPSGTQGPEHPNPGRPYHGTTRTAYLPDSPEGRDVLRLLKQAFNQRVIFTIGTSTTTGLLDCVTWNDIHHKTSMYGGPDNYGYPDAGYLTRVKDELKAKGIV